MEDGNSNSPDAHVDSDDDMGSLDTRIAVLGQQIDDIITMFLSSKKFEAKSLFSTADRVTKAQELYEAGGTYPRGCSEFVCAVLGIPYELAKTLMGTDPDEIDDWSTVPAGAIVGWQKPNGPFDHVSVYVNDGTSKFIDVRQPAPDSKPRRLGSYGAQKVYLSSRFGN